MLAAALAEGETVLENAAREPEIADLADCLNSHGRGRAGRGTATITIRGVSKLKGRHPRGDPDRIEAGTFAVAAAMAGGEVTLTGLRAGLLDALSAKLRRPALRCGTTARP
jgi:UDP-N-acetylglucosamine 1-carboxyvinyltransferase